MRQVEAENGVCRRTVRSEEEENTPLLSAAKRLFTTREQTRTGLDVLDGGKKENNPLRRILNNFVALLFQGSCFIVEWRLGLACVLSASMLLNT